MEREDSFKLLIIGDQAVGKTSLITRYCDNTFTDAYTYTIGLNYKLKSIDYKGSTIRLSIFDPTGQERFKSVPRAFYKRADGIILSYDSTTRSSFDNIMGWVKEIHESTNDEIPKILVATKCDLEDERKVPSSEGQELAAVLKISFFETSAKTNTNINEAFLSLVSATFGTVLRPSGKLTLSVHEYPKKKKCCKP